MTIQGDVLQRLVDGTNLEFTIAFEAGDHTRAFQAIDQLGLLANQASVEDRRTLERMQADLRDRVHELPASASAAAAPAQVEGMDPSNMAQLPPAGLRNAHSNCALLAAAQLLTGAPRIAKKIMDRDPELRALFQQIYHAQARDAVVDQRLGDALREKVGTLLAIDGRGRGSAYAEWVLDGNLSNTKEPDILPVLHAFLAAGGLSYQFVSECNGNTLVDDKTGAPRVENELSLGLDLSGGERNLESLLDQYFVNTAEGGMTTRKQFITAPDDLVLSALRYGSAGGGHKIGANLTVPEAFDLKREFTQTRETIRYELVSCDIHHGADGKRGHYTCLRKVDSTWYLANDDNVLEVTDPRPYMAQGYVFHYQKVGAAPTTLDLTGDVGPPPPRTCGEVAARVGWLACWTLGRIYGLTRDGIQAMIARTANAKKD
ncbi:MAG: ubiquitin carboxyl-terminal hydrolase family protein [Simkaniaceae bacterium]|nr:ubiquitin carboxyl-terminal hydrolase family protein [Candidatus Sacchlamyda saccharinae]